YSPFLQCWCVTRSRDEARGSFSDSPSPADWGLRTAFFRVHGPSGSLRRSGRSLQCAVGGRSSPKKRSLRERSDCRVAPRAIPVHPCRFCTSTVMSGALSPIISGLETSRARSGDSLRGNSGSLSRRVSLRVSLRWHRTKTDVNGRKPTKEDENA